MNEQNSIRIFEDSWLRDIIQCPSCCSQLTFGSSIVCISCGFVDNSGKDLRISTSRDVIFSFKNLPATSPENILASVETIGPTLTYQGPLAIRDSRELMSEVSARLPNGGVALDLGCGPRDQAACLEFLGFKYVGVDYGNDAADFLADAHSLPFVDESFDCVFSYAVLEHLHNPFLAIKEVSRVLKEGGWFIGTVSQGEPFHNSYFHHTSWGLASLVSSMPELRIVRIWASSDTLRSLASMGRYSKIIRGALGILHYLNLKFPWLTPRKMRWPMKDKELDRLFRAGSICFAIQKHAERARETL